MEENVLVPAPEYKVHKERAIYLATFFGGPLAGGYMVAENFRQMGDTSKYKNAMMITLTFTAILITALIFVPGIEKIPRLLFPLFYMLLIQFFIKKYQESALRKHIKNGGATFTGGRAVVIAIIGIAIFVAVAVVALMAIGELGPAQPA